MIYETLEGKIHFFEGHTISEGLQGVQGPQGKRGGKGPTGPQGDTGAPSTLQGWEGLYPVSILTINDIEVTGQAYLEFSAEFNIIDVLSQGNLITLKGGFTYIVDIYVCIYATETMISLFKGEGELEQEITIPTGLSGGSMHMVLAPDADTNYYLIAFTDGGYIGVNNSYVSIVKMGAGVEGEAGASPTGATGSTGATGPTGPQGPPAPARSTYSSYYA